MKYTFLMVETVQQETLVTVEADTRDEAGQMAVAGETDSEKTIRTLGVINRELIEEIA